MANLAQNNGTDNTLTTEIFTRISNDVNGNPRYVCHFLNIFSDDYSKDGLKLSISNKYDRALFLAKKIGGKKYHTKSYGGGIVFQSYNIAETLKHIIELKAN